MKQTILLIAAMMSISGCTVYAPSGPFTPMVHDDARVEATAGLGFNGATASVAVVPVRHCVLFAGGGLLTKKFFGIPHHISSVGTDDYTQQQKQFSVGGGYYRRGPEWYTHVGAGLGWANTHFSSLDYQTGRAQTLLFFSTSYQYNIRRTFYDTRYFAQFVQAYATRDVFKRPHEGCAIGAVARLTHLAFRQADVLIRNNNDSVLYASASPVRPASWYLEPSLFCNAWFGSFLLRPSVVIAVPLNGPSDALWRKGYNNPSVSFQLSLGWVLQTRKHEGGAP